MAARISRRPFWRQVPSFRIAVSLSLSPLRRARVCCLHPAPFFARRSFATGDSLISEAASVLLSFAPKKPDAIRNFFPRTKTPRFGTKILSCKNSRRRKLAVRLWSLSLSFLLQYMRACICVCVCLRLCVHLKTFVASGYGRSYFFGSSDCCGANWITRHDSVRVSLFRSALITKAE